MLEILNRAGGVMTKCYCEKAVITRAAPFPAISSSSDPYIPLDQVVLYLRFRHTIVFTDHYVNHSEGINKASENTIPPHLRQHFLTLGAHAQRGLRYLVCLSVDRLANLAVQGTGRPMTATNRFRVGRSLILIGRFS